MTPNKQVSPVIRISRGERDASARATHLEAASEKYSETTIERKQMSITTNFKRIALVAVASLGLGVLSSVPAQATINADSLTLSSATSTQTNTETYSATSSATVTMAFFGAAQDSVTITAALVSAPAGATALPVLRLVETSAAMVDTASSSARPIGDSITANTATNIRSSSSTAQASAKFAVYLATAGTTITAPATVGTYVVKITPAAVGVGPLVNSTAQTLTITVTTSPALSTTVAAATSTTYMQLGSEDANLASQDSTVIALKTAGVANASMDANIKVVAKNAASIAVSNIESITATITGAGMLGSHATLGSVVATGRSILVKTGDYVGVFSDGNAGTGTITFAGSVSGVVIGTKTVTFTSDAATKWATATIAATDSTVISVGTRTMVSALAQDASSFFVRSLVGGTDYYAHSSDTSVATVATYSEDLTTGYGVLVTGVAVGTTQITFGNAATLAASTIKSAPVTVRVGSATPSNVTVTTDKTSYAPGEKMSLTVTILDSTAKAVIGSEAYNNIFTSTGIVASSALTNNSSLPTANVVVYSGVTNSKVYTIYAPVTGGPLTFTWTGGTALATANQVAKTLTVTVTDAGAANTAAIAALQTAVASLRTLIVTLTNLVLKIQKKVKA